LIVSRSSLKLEKLATSESLLFHVEGSGKRTIAVVEQRKFYSFPLFEFFSKPPPPQRDELAVLSHLQPFQHLPRPAAGIAQA